VLNARTVAVLAVFPVVLAVGCDQGETSQKGNGGAATTSTSTTTSTSGTGSTTAGTGGAAASTLHVSGNKLVDNGKTVKLQGVDQSGTEYQCTHANAGIFDVGGGSPSQDFVNDMLSWNVNSVRVPLNEDCWLGINGFPVSVTSAAYQSAISGWVTQLRQSGLYVIVDLHWNNGGTNQSTGQEQMADLDHAPAFWTSVASTFKSDQGILFDLYNEPHDIAWSCWQNGGCQVNGWNVAGMNQLITAVRGTGAKNVLMAGGINFAGDLSQWLANKPTDPDNNLAASFHSYNFSNCADMSCWTSQIQPVAAQVPLITGELGENDCAATYVTSFMDWADTQGISYLGWSWNVYSNPCTGPGLISDWTGTPTAMGQGFKSHY
jgi:Cellulase (glycosyl hydrolase family 5)